MIFVLIIIEIGHIKVNISNYQAVISLVKLYSILSAEAFAKKQRLWKFLPKQHLTEHLTMDAPRIFGSPKLYWCYPDESEIGTACKVAESVSAPHIHKSVIRKHRLLPD